MNKRWPLHPKPGDNQILYEWVKDLANLYDISPRNFRTRVLKLIGEESLYFRASYIPEKALIILSNGTGISIYDLRWRF